MFGRILGYICDGHVASFAFFGGVPRSILPVNEIPAYP